MKKTGVAMSSLEFFSFKLLKQELSSVNFIYTRWIFFKNSSAQGFR